MRPGLGRLLAPDDRDKKHLMSASLTSTDLTQRYWWSSGAWFDQGNSSACVGHAWAHWLEDGPVTQHGIAVDPFVLYREAQHVDEWPGNDYDGSSVRGGAKVLVTRGLVAGYMWTWNVETLAAAVLTSGPSVVGTNWYDDMFDPDPTGRVSVSGSFAGGHAWLINGVNTRTESFRGKNSWGRSWGRLGHFTISFADMQRLLDEDGEACLAVEVKAPM